VVRERDMRVLSKNVGKRRRPSRTPNRFE